MNHRPNWDQFYLEIAKAVSRRGECKRRKVGAIIVKNHSIVGEGYNGAAPGEKSCLEGACPRAESDAPMNTNYAESGCHVIHAETNAMLRTSWGDMRNSTLYVTDEPCKDCWPKIKNTGITRVVWPGSDTTINGKKVIRPSYEQVIAIESILLQEYGEISDPTKTINRLFMAVENPSEIVETE